jgi:tetratricopeptide (TPR) repeat protein
VDSRPASLRTGGRLATPAWSLLLATLLAACAGHAPAPYERTPGATPGGPSPGSAQPATPGERPQPPQARQYRLGPAASALVAQAHTQANGGEFNAAAATLERAQRIEPDNPLLWVELGRLQLQQNNAAQADGMARKALALATGDPAAQASAWRLIADSLRSRGRNPEAADADQRATALAPR